MRDFLRERINITIWDKDPRLSIAYRIAESSNACNWFAAALLAGAELA